MVRLVWIITSHCVEASGLDPQHSLFANEPSNLFARMNNPSGDQLVYDVSPSSNKNLAMKSGTALPGGIALASIVQDAVCRILRYPATADPGDVCTRNRMVKTSLSIAVPGTADREKIAIAGDDSLKFG